MFFKPTHCFSQSMIGIFYKKMMGLIGTRLLPFSLRMMLDKIFNFAIAGPTMRIVLDYG